MGSIHRYTSLAALDVFGTVCGKSQKQEGLEYKPSCFPRQSTLACPPFSHPFSAKYPAPRPSVRPYRSPPSASPRPLSAFPPAMSHLAVLTPSIPSTGSSSYLVDNTQLLCSPPSSKFPLTLPDGFSRPLSNSTRDNNEGVQSLPASPVSSAFPQRPGFKRSATSSASVFVSTSQEGSRYGAMHYAQTHFSRSTLLVHPNSEHLQQIVTSPQEHDEDIQELLLTNTDEDELSQPPSTPGLEARIPPRGSSATSCALSSKESVESDKVSDSSYPAQVSELVAPQTPSKRHSSNCLHQVHTWLAKIPARV